MIKYSLVLASGSPRRKEILSRHGIEFTIIKSDCSEETDISDPAEVVKELSMRKALDVQKKVQAENDTACVILAADTVVSIDGKVLGKPVDEADAKGMLQNLSGREHEVYTGVSILGLNTEEEINVCFAECTKVNVHTLSDKEIEAYIKTGEPMDKAGAYGIQGSFGIFIRGIEGDYDNVVGLPISRIYQEIKGKLWTLN